MNIIKQKKTFTIYGTSSTARFTAKFNINFIPSIVHLRSLSMYCKGNLDSPAAEYIYIIKCNGLITDENVLYHFVMNTAYNDSGTSIAYTSQSFHAAPNIPFKCSGNVNGNDIEFLITAADGSSVDMTKMTGGFGYAMTFVFEE